MSEQEVVYKTCPECAGIGVTSYKPWYEQKWWPCVCRKCHGTGISDEYDVITRTPLETQKEQLA